MDPDGARAPLGLIEHLAFSTSEMSGRGRWFRKNQMPSKDRKCMCVTGDALLSPFHPNFRKPFRPPVENSIVGESTVRVVPDVRFDILGKDFAVPEFAAGACKERDEPNGVKRWRVRWHIAHVPTAERLNRLRLAIVLLLFVFLTLRFAVFFSSSLRRESFGLAAKLLYSPVSLDIVLIYPLKVVCHDTIGFRDYCIASYRDHWWS